MVRIRKMKMYLFFYVYLHNYMYFLVQCLRTNVVACNFSRYI